MARITSERLALARTFLAQYDTLTTPFSNIEWLMLKFSCSRQVAERLVHAVEQDTTTDEIGKTPIQRAPRKQARS